MGQLSRMLRDQFLVDVVQLNKVQGRPFKVSEIHQRIMELTA
jgi:2-oxoglutarate ferredoxin oxidoreductase subunit alpha